MIIFLLVLAAFAIAIFVFIHQPKFGKLPSGERLRTIQQSPNYRNAAFQNIHETPALAEGETYYGVIKNILFSDKSSTKPKR